MNELEKYGYIDGKCFDTSLFGTFNVEGDLFGNNHWNQPL